MLETYILRIDKNLEKDDFDRLSGWVSKEKKERISRFYRFEDAQRSLLGDILARYAICKRKNVKNKDLVFGKNEYGKPLLLEPVEIHFNISHSGKHVACAVNDNPVGIDVETVKPIDLNIAKRFFSQDEYHALLSQPEELRQRYFFMIWTLKESYIKAEGKGLSIPLNSFSIKIDSLNTAIITCSELEKYCFSQSFLDGDIIYALCTLGSHAKKIITWDIEIFLKETYCLF